MTDGNTGIQVAPIAEDEAMRLSSIFTRAAQAIVDASTYPKQVEQLREELQKVSNDLYNKTLHAEELDRTLHEVREQRDSARVSLEAAKSDIATMSRMSENDNSTIHNLQDKLDTMSHDLDTTKAERDNYGLRAMQLEDEVASWKAKAEATRAKLDDIATMFKVEPEPEKPTELPAFLEPEPEPVTYQAPPVEPPKTEPPKAQSELIGECEPRYHYDYDPGRYRRTDLADAEATKSDDIPY